MPWCFSFKWKISFNPRYCDSQGLPKPRSQCDPGYVCKKGAYTSTPTDGDTGSLCPAGGYCLVGSYEPKPCSPGYYSNVTGARNSHDCRDCDPGYYCNKASKPSPEGPCNAGTYCKKNAISPNGTFTQPGHYAPAGSAFERPCLPGTFQPNHKAPNCTICPAGDYCPREKMEFSIACDAGFYCPAGSQVQFHCDKGTYNPRNRSESEEACLPCPPGKFCSLTALKLPDGKYINCTFLL